MTVEAADARSSCPQCKAVFRGGFLRCPRDGSLLSSAEEDPLVGSVLAERYVIDALLGEGGIGRVYRAHHVRMSRKYAIKVPFGELNYDAKVRARFHNEAEAASRLSHPNVIGVVDVGESPEGLLYLAMDLAEGESLATVLGREGALDGDRVRRIFTQIAEGLRHAHERGLVHRDLKPENIILERDSDGSERARIVDFGIAILQETGIHSGRMTTQGIVLGTPHYMAPEQATDQGVDHRTDLFSLGLILYEMLAGVLPFDGSPIEVARQNLAHDPPPIHQRVPGLVVDRLLEGLAFRLIEKRPERRPQSAAEVLGLIELIRSDRQTARVQLKLGEVVEVEEMGVAPVSAKARSADEGGVAPWRPRPVARPQPLEPTDGEEPPLVRVADESIGFVRPSSRRPTIIAAIVLLLVMGIGVAVMLRGGGEDAARPDARMVAMVAPDAARAPVIDAAVLPVDAAEIPDAAPVIVDAGAAKRPDAGRPPPKVDAGRPPPRPDARKAEPKPDAGPATPPSEKSLTALYNDVGKALNDLITARGASEGASYKKRYLAIPYLEAIRKPEMRADAMSKLRALAKDIAAAQ